jgi:hypothetical protein
MKQSMPTFRGTWIRRYPCAQTQIDELFSTTLNHPEQSPALSAHFSTGDRLWNLSVEHDL